jgi:hypothetical protein
MDKTPGLAVSPSLSFFHSFPMLHLFPISKKQGRVDMTLPSVVLELFTYLWTASFFLFSL